MRDTRKLQFASELIDEAADGIDSDIGDRLKKIGAEVDELRGKVHHEEAVEYAKNQS